MGAPATSPAELLRQLIRFDTTNPPGNETACLEHLRGTFEGTGADCRMLRSPAGRDNLVVRVAGRGAAPPLLMQGHVDVVTTAGQRWSHPPFDGDLVRGWVWGRGALDMKSGVAIMVSALLRCWSAASRQPATWCCAVWPTRRRAGSTAPGSWSSGTRTSSPASGTASARAGRRPST